jgi:hypothetical protein
MLSEEAKWYRVSLRFFGDELPLEQVGSILSLEPSVAGPKDDVRRGQYRFQQTAWVHRFTTDTTESFETQLSRLVPHLEAVEQGLRSLLLLPDVRGDVFLGFSSGNGQGGCSFSPDLLARIGALGLSLTLDLYPPDVDESDGIE